MTTPSRPLDPSLYDVALTQDDLLFFKQAANITDDDDQEGDGDAIRQHILTVQAKAYAVYSYPCIRRFAFIRPKIASLPGYEHALKLLETRANLILLDVGCCFGNDIRKAVLDGWPAHNIVATDLRKGFWDVGHELFRSTPKSFPVKFLEGDILDDAFLSISPDGANQSDTDHDDGRTELDRIITLNPLTHKVSAIHASSLFHLFTEENQLLLARRLAALLVPKPGSIIFGQHIGLPVKGLRGDARVRMGPEESDSGKTKSFQMFCHSPDSWTKMWTEEVFDGSGGSSSPRIKVDTKLIEMKRNDSTSDPGTKLWMMSWYIQIL
ncbi:hypothetical protein CPC08DRAFT_759666 [Agrocybe pediades]|nr:hypothetical protein CPC08DRAFT_759666 [Agrocybe pediades]